jgi:hypothetical protein
MTGCRPRSTVFELKNLLPDELSIPKSQQRLLFSGMLLGNTKTLHGSNLRAGSILHLVLPVQGGHSAANFKFADVSNSSAMKRVEFSPSAPRYR